MLLKNNNINIIFLSINTYENYYIYITPTEKINETTILLK